MLATRAGAAAGPSAANLGYSVLCSAARKVPAFASGYQATSARALTAITSDPASLTQPQLRLAQRAKRPRRDRGLARTEATDRDRATHRGQQTKCKTTHSPCLSFSRSSDSRSGCFCAKAEQVEMISTGQLMLGKALLTAAALLGFGIWQLLVLRRLRREREQRRAAESSQPADSATVASAPCAERAPSEASTETSTETSTSTPAVASPASGSSSPSRRQ